MPAPEVLTSPPGASPAFYRGARVPDAPLKDYTMKKPVVCRYVTGAIPIEPAALESLIGADAIAKGERRFDLETVGPWRILRSIRGLAMTVESREPHYLDPDKTSPATVAFHGLRTGRDCRTPGTWTDCRVSVGGRKRSAFTTSQLFELPDGRLIDVAVLYCRD